MIVGQRLFVPIPKKITYSEFKEHLARGEVESVVLGKEQITGTLRQASEEGKTPSAEPGSKPAVAKGAAFVTAQVTPPDEKLVLELQAAKIPFDGEGSGQSVLVLLPLLGAAVRGGLPPLRRRFPRGREARGYTRSWVSARAVQKLSPETGTGVTFDDVAGCDEAKAELREMVDFLRDPSRFHFSRRPHPEACSCSARLARARRCSRARSRAKRACRSSRSPAAISWRCSVGVGAARVRDLFEQAKAKAPCIVFIDEIDAVGRQRGVSMGVVNDEREQTLNQLLSEMDGFEINSGVILLAATNRPEILDRALLRPGRFDRQVVIDAPDLVGREAILRVHARGKPLARDVDLLRVAQSTPGISGADLANT
jgi:cell division protease FtsH